MLFQGEEYGERAPFLFFSDHIDEEIADGDPGGAPAGVRGLRLVRGAGPRPAGPGDLRALQAHARRRAGGPARRGRRPPLGLRAELAAHPEPRRRSRQAPDRPARRHRSWPTSGGALPLDGGVVLAAGDVSADGRSAAWPGRWSDEPPGLARRPVPARRHLGRRRHQLRPLLRERHRGGALPVRRRTATRSASSCERHRVSTGTATSRHPARPALRLPRARAVRARAGATASTRPSCCSTPTRRRSTGDARAGEDASLGYRSAAEDDADLDDRRRGRRAAIPKRVVIDAPSTGRATGRRAPPGTDRHLRGPRQGLHQAASRTCREELRGTYAGLAVATRRSRTSRSSGVTAVELLPVHHIADDGLPADRASRTTGATTRSASSRPHSRYSARAAAASRCASSRRWSRPCTAAGHRGHPRRGLQPHRGGQPPRPDALLPGHRQRAYYRLSPDDPRYYMDFTGTGNTLNIATRSVLQLIMDSLRYWVLEMHVDGFRFDLASALARELHDVDRLSRLLRRHPPGPGALAGQAHRRAVGRRAGRLPGGQLPGPAGRSGTASTATRCAASGRATAGRSRSWPTGSPARATCTRGRPPALRVDQLRHRPRRLHAARPRLLQREAQRGERRGQPGRHRRQQLLELRRRGADRRPRDRRAARAPAAQLPGHAVPLPGHADAARAATRSAAPSAATTTPTARTTRSLVRLGARRARQRLLEFTKRLIALRRAHPVFTGASSSPARTRARACRTCGGSAPTGTR